MNRRAFLTTAAAACALVAAGQTTKPIPAGYDAWPFDAKEAVRRQVETSQAFKQPVVFALIREDAPVPKGHPETQKQTP